MGSGKSNIKRRKEIERAIGKLEDARREKQNFVGDLVARYEAGEITQNEYKKLLDRVLEGASLSKWNRYYGDSINVYRRHLNELRRPRVNVVKFGVPIAILLLIGSFYLFVFSGLDFSGDLDGQILFEPDEDFFFDDCSNLDSWDVGLGEWRVRNILQDSRCTSQNYVGACGDYCTYNMVNSPLFDLSNAVEADISFDWFLRNLDENENFSFYLNDGTNEVEVGTVVGVRGQQWQNGQITLQIENYISLTDSVSVRFQCDGINGTYPAEYCGVDNINVTIDSAQGDVTPPVVSIIEPTARTYTNDEAHPLLIQATVTDDIDPSGNLIVEYSLDDGQTNFTMVNTVGDTFEAEASSVVSGNYRVNVYASDSSGNMNNGEFTDFSVDNTLIAGCGAVIDDVSEGLSYSLTQDIIGFADCINVSLDSISLDGQGFGIVGSGQGRGINILQDSVDTFSVTNINISLFEESIGDSNLSVSQDGVFISVSNSEVGQIVSPGGDNSATDAGDGGSVVLLDSNITDKIDVRGGDFDNFEGGFAGDGGDIFFQSEFVNLTGANLNVRGGITQLGSNPSGTVTFNTTSGFEDNSGGIYGTRFKIHLINGSQKGGEIRWLNEFNAVINFRAIGQYSQIGHNYSFVNPVTDGGKGINLGPLNSPARVTFYGMTDNFLDPKIWKDNLECTDCTIIDPLNTVGTIEFDVSGFSEYRIGDEIIITNSPPVVENIEVIPAQFITPGGTTDVAFEVTVSDADGFTDIQSVDAEFVGPLGTSRVGPSCVYDRNNGPNEAVVICTIGIEFYDEPGAWDVSATADDGEFQDTLTEQDWFSLAETLSVDMQGVNWITNALSPGDQDVPADSQQVLTNLGNKEITQITITGASLLGDTLGGSIDSNSFSVDIASSCVDSLRLENGLEKVIVGAVLPRGVSSQETLLYCAEQVPVGLPADGYSGQWELLFSLILSFVTVFSMAISVRKKRLNELLKGLSKDELLEVLGERILEIKEHEGKVPISIFKEDMSPAEVLCKYLKENEKMRFSEIAGIINRDQRTVWNNYHNAVRKSGVRIRPGKGVGIPVEIFGNRKLSVLESVVYYLKGKGYKNMEIAKMIDRDSRNVWTLYSRAKKKLKA